ncbi:NAD(P)/FAD-dependent oxidoreductase [Actinoplanes sp. NPDC020271]|uniref:NAD(P)/FAD-dependent oxidoreductase n=1 Tax=Actinoplanes sp. NPDC020271 TaxID=3363896 RepID=UPI0037882989
MTSAIVLGGGFAGVLVANVLARHFATVTVIESGDLPDGPLERSGVPQARHNHVLVAGGARALSALSPGIVDELLELGAQRRDLPGDALILGAQGWFHRHHTGAYLIACSRWLLDAVLRRRLLTGPRITVRTRTRAAGLTGSAGRITGVRLDGEGALAADLVVDATGRRSRSPSWLAALGLPPIPEEVVDPGVAYVTRIYQAPDGLGATIPAVMLHPRGGGHGATVFPIEGGRWIVTLTGTRGNPPSAGAFTACAEGLPDPMVSRLITAARPLGPARPFRATANRRRRFPALPGFLAVGDALTTMNPVYSHGMSVAALQAVRLDRLLADGAPGLQAAAAAEADLPWRMATTRDRAAPAAGNRLPRLTPALVGRMFRAQTLIEPEVPVPVALVPLPALDTTAAVAQFPALAGWWAAA